MRLTKLITFRSLNTRRLRSILTLFGIILGVAGMYSINATNQSAYISITRLFEGTSGRVNLEIRSSADIGGIPENLLDSVSSLEGIDIATAVIRIPAVIYGEDMEGIELNFFGTGSGGFLIYGIDPEKDREIRDYNIAAGEFIKSNDDTPEIVLVEDYARENDIKTGEIFSVVTAYGKIDLLVTGFISKEGPGLLNFSKIGFMELKSVQSISGREAQVDWIDVAVSGATDNPDVISKVKDNLTKELGNDYSVIYPDNQGDRMAEMLEGYQIGLNFLAGIALFVGAFLIYNAFSMTVVERTRELGLLRSIGMSSVQVTGQVIIEGLVSGIFGASLGVLLGAFFSRGIAGIMSEFLGYSIDFSKTPISILVGSILVGVFVTMLAAILPALKAGRISPLEALRIRGKADEGFITKFGWIFGLILLGISTWILILNPFPYDIQFRLGSVTVFSLFLGATLIIPATIRFWQVIVKFPIRIIFSKLGEIGARNIERAKKRAMLTCASLMIGVSMIVVIQGITGAFTADLYDWMDAYAGGDIFISAAVPMDENLKEKFESVSDVQVAAPMRYINVKWQTDDGVEEQIAFLAVDVKSYTEVTDFIFSNKEENKEDNIMKLSAGDSIFISSVISEKYGISSGDLIPIQTTEGIKDFTVASVILDFYNQGMVVTGSWEDLNKYFDTSDANTFLIKINPEGNINSVIDEISSKYKDEYQLVIESNNDLKDRAKSLMNQAFSMFDILGIIAVLVAALGVMNTLFMNVSERTKEIGMLRSIGMARFQVIKIILAEAAFLGVIGGVLGIGFGIILNRIILLSMGAMSGYDLEFVLPVNAIWIGIIISLLMSQLAALLPAIKAAKTPMLEAIRYE